MCSTIIPYDSSNTSPFAPGKFISSEQTFAIEKFRLCVALRIASRTKWVFRDYCTISTVSLIRSKTHAFPLHYEKRKDIQWNHDAKRLFSLSLSLSKFSNLTWKCDHKCNCTEIHDIATRIVTKSIRGFTGRGPKVHDKYNKSRRVSKRII